MGKEELTGNVSLRHRKSQFRTGQLVLQVEVARPNPAPEFSDGEPFVYWIDATPEHLQQLPEVSLKQVLEIAK